MGMLHDPNEKRARTEVIQNEIAKALDGYVAPNWAPKICTYPLAESITAFEDTQYAEESNMLPEERGTFLLVRYVLEHILGTNTPEEADAFFVPLYFPVHEVFEIRISQAIEALEYLDSGKKHILCSPWDTYPRPWLNRANPYCPMGSGVIDRSDWMENELRWFDDRFILFNLESTIDSHPNDIGILPTLLPDKRAYISPSERPLLYSFCGVLCYHPLHDDHVRGVNRQDAWERLRQLPQSDVFVGTLEDAKSRFGSDTTFRDLPAMSRFTLCPAGWARWSFRLMESVAAQSIPVVLSDYYQKPFAPWVPWDRFSLQLPETSLYSMDTILRRFSQSHLNALSNAGGLTNARLDYRSMAEWMIMALSKKLAIEYPDALNEATTSKKIAPRNRLQYTD